MRNTVLVHKIERLLDLKGEVAGSESVAAEYAGAVKELRLFVEDVSEALASRRYPDAAQTLLARPPVAKEIAALKFERLETWQSFCAERKIEAPVFPAQEQCDGIDAFLKSPAVAEPVQKLYRKAIRTKDTNLLVRTLRILSETDKSRSWASDLALAEETRIKELQKEFETLESAGENEKAAMTAEALLGDSWLTPPGAETTGRAKAFLAAQEVEMLAREQEEVLDLLRVCMENWDADKARAYVGCLDKMSVSGTPVPGEDAAVVAAARKRYEDEEKAAAFDAAWRAASEKLFIAVEHGNPAEIRAAIGAVEFLDRPPEEELYRKAGLVIAHDDAKKRQKLRIIAGSALAVVLLVLGVSVYFIMNRNFNIRCEEEAKNLELLCGKPGDINTLDDLLSKIAVEVPKVWNDPRVQKYVHRLDEKKGEQARKLEELSSGVAAFEQLAAKDWEDVDVRETGAKIATAEKDLRDIAHRSLEDGRNEVAERLKAIRSSFDSYAALCLEKRIAAAEESFMSLLPKMTDAGERLKSELLAGQLAVVVTNCEAEAANWKELYSECSPDLLAKLEAADFTVAKKKSSDAAALFGKLYAAETAEAALQARNELLELYSEFKQVAELKDLDYQASDVATLLAEGSANQKALAEFVNGISGEPSEQRFDIVKESIANAGEVLGEFNGIRFEVNDREKKGSEEFDTRAYEFFIRGGPEDYAISRVDGSRKIRGDIFGYSEGSILKFQSPVTMDDLLKHLRQKSGRFAYGYDLVVDPFESSRDLQEIREVAKLPNPSVTSLGQVIEQKVAKMLKAATAEDYLQKQKDFSFEKGNTLNAYRTVQMLNAYFDWLVKLKIMPPDSQTAAIMNKCRNLALWPVEINTSSIPRDVKNKENLFWLFTENANVARHNEKCAQFVKGLTKNEIIMNFGRFHVLAPWLKNVGNWRVEFAGVLAMGEGSVVGPKCEEDSVTLHALRKQDGKNVLVPVLSPGEEGWRQEPALVECSEGEPLFRFASATGLRDFFGELAKSEGSYPPSVILHVRKIFSADEAGDVGN